MSYSDIDWKDQDKRRNFEVRMANNMTRNENPIENESLILHNSGTILRTRSNDHVVEHEGGKMPGTLSSQLARKLTSWGIRGKTNGTANDTNNNERTPLISDFSSDQSMDSDPNTKDTYGAIIDPGGLTVNIEARSAVEKTRINDELNGEIVDPNIRTRNEEIEKDEKQQPNHLCLQNQETKIEFDKIAMKRLISTATACTFFMIVEFIGGYLAGSLAIQTDAAHLFVDLISVGISISSLWISTKEPTNEMSYGYHRAEVIGAFVSVIIIWMLNFLLTFLAIKQIIDYGVKGYGIDPVTMLIVSGIGVGINIVMGAILHQPGHSHGGKNKKTSSNAAIESGEPVKKQRMNINVWATYIHVAGDVLQSFLVFIAALIIYQYKDYEIADPICTILGAIMVTGMTVPILKNVLNILMQGAPEGITVKDIDLLLRTVPYVFSSHKLRIWAITTDKFAVTGHVVVNPNANKDDVLRDATRKVQDMYDFFDAALQVESPKEGATEGECHMMCSNYQ